MKRLILVALIVIAMGGMAWAESKIQTTDKLHYNAVIFTGQISLRGCFILTNGTDDVTLTIYDATNTSGRIIRQITIAGSDYYGGFALPYSILMQRGIYATVSGTGASYWIDYQGLY